MLENHLFLSYIVFLHMKLLNDTNTRNCLQYQNRDVAMKMLISKLVEIKEREHLDKIADIKGVQKEITWGSQIRSYVFMPYTLAKDHRTGYEMGNINAVMDGDLDGFINAYLIAASSGTLGENIE